MSIKVIFMGTGTSVGVPMIGCECSICTSDNQRNKRLRASVCISDGSTNIVVDTTPDFRQQALIYKLKRVDAVLFTHSHADHIFGFDDIRRFNTIQNSVIPAYATSSTLANVRRAFGYIKSEKTEGVFRPLINFIEVDQRFQAGTFDVTVVPVIHGPDVINGYHFKSGDRTFGYVPDCSAMSDESVALLKGVDVMVLDALRRTPHKTHFSIGQSIDVLRKIGSGKSYLIHMNHEVDYDEIERELPADIRLSYDGLVIEW